MELLVFGAGSLGSLLGGLFAREHEVTLIGREAHVQQVEAEGLAITGMVDERVHPRAKTDVTDVTADIALVTVKSYDTQAAAQALGSANIDAVCSLQNGLGNEEILADTLSIPILGGSVTYGADLIEPGVVEMTGAGSITVGPFRDGGEQFSSSLIDAFHAADIEASATEDIETTLWRKVAINAAINPVAALARCRNGALVEGPLADVADAAAREAAAVARENGVAMDDDAITDDVQEVAEATAANRCSMLQDVLSGGRTEINAINGAIVDRSDGVDVPVNETLTSLVRGLEEYELTEVD